MDAVRGGTAVIIRVNPPLLSPDGGHKDMTADRTNIVQASLGFLLSSAIYLKPFEHPHIPQSPRAGHDGQREQPTLERQQGYRANKSRMSPRGN